MADSPSFRAAVPTARRTQAFLALLCRFGLDKMFDQVGQAQLKVPQPGVPSTGLRAAPEPDDAPVLDVGIELGEIVRQMATGDAIVELASIVLDVPSPEAAEDAPIDVILGAVGPFGLAWQRLMGTLLSSGTTSVSTAVQTTT